MKCSDPNNLEAEVIDKAERLLQMSGYVALRSIRCEPHGNTLVLRGCVKTFYLKQLAQTLVNRLPEVQTVDNQVVVNG